MYRFGKVEAYLRGGDQVVYNHGVLEVTNIGAPAYLHEYAGDPQMLQASKDGWEMMQPYLSVAGSPQGGEALYFFAAIHTFDSNLLRDTCHDLTIDYD